MPISYSVRRSGGESGSGQHRNNHTNAANLRPPGHRRCCSVGESSSKSCLRRKNSGASLQEHSAAGVAMKTGRAAAARKTMTVAMTATLLWPSPSRDREHRDLYPRRIRLLILPFPPHDIPPPPPPPLRRLPDPSLWTTPIPVSYTHLTLPTIYSV